MKEIHRNPQTNNYDVDITTEEWKEILRLPPVQERPNILDALEKWYRAPAYTSSCKQLSYQYGRPQQYFSVQNRMLGEFAVRHLNRFYLAQDNGKETYWAVAWIELKKNRNEYIVQLRPELVEAIKQLNLFH